MIELSFCNLYSSGEEESTSLYADPSCSVTLPNEL